jgi:hypothetical protein
MGWDPAIPTLAKLPHLAMVPAKSDYPTNHTVGFLVFNDLGDSAQRREQRAHQSQGMVLTRVSLPRTNLPRVVPSPRHAARPIHSAGSLQRNCSYRMPVAPLL